eukprot:2732717-Rhodomonas_salina.1
MSWIPSGGLSTRTSAWPASCHTVYAKYRHSLPEMSSQKTRAKCGSSPDSGSTGEKSSKVDQTSVGIAQDV